MISPTPVNFKSPIAVRIVVSIGAASKLPFHRSIAAFMAVSMKFPAEVKIAVQSIPSKKLPMCLPIFSQSTESIALVNQSKIPVTSLEVSIPATLNHASESNLNAYARSSIISFTGLNTLLTLSAQPIAVFCILSNASCHTFSYSAVASMISLVRSIPAPPEEELPLEPLLGSMIFNSSIPSV